MPLPFPGMDPWLEQPGLWTDLHTSLIAALRDELGPLLRPRYRVAIEQRTYIAALQPSELVGRPDASVMQSPHLTSPAGVATATIQVAEPVIVELEYDEVIERYLEIRKPVSGEVVTVIEILSPKNKRLGEGRTRYEHKRRQIVYSMTNLVEIDLLRGWEPMHFTGPDESYHTAYRILVSRSEHRPRAELYPFGIRDSIPRFALPLLADDEEPIVDLTPILHGVYDRAGYDLVIDYLAEPTPPLSGKDAAWAREWLKKRPVSSN